MKIDWAPLRKCLATLRRSDVEIPFWWRDDDAVTVTPALERLTSLSEAATVPVHIAIIPDLMENSLVSWVKSTNQIIPVVHGWRHENHESPEAKKSEFGTMRADGIQEINSGLSRMQSAFGSELLPLFVPPWNRIDPEFLPVLATAGYRGLSTFSARTNRSAVSGLVQINTHIDPIDWRGTRDLKDPDLLIRQTIDLLEQRASRAQDPTEPLGYLTHHLVHSDPLWDFTEQFLTELLEGGVSVRPLAPFLETNNEPT